MRNAALVPTLIALLLLGGCARQAVAPRIDRLTFGAAGDSVTYEQSVNLHGSRLQQVWQNVEENEAVGVLKDDAAQYEIAMTKIPFMLERGKCLFSATQCVYNPGDKILDLPLQVGKRWTSEFKADVYESGAPGSQAKPNQDSGGYPLSVDIERRVEAVETVSVAAGDFEVFHISVSGRISGFDGRGNVYRHRLTGDEYVSLAGGRYLLVKRTLRSSSGERLAQELVSTTFRAGK